MLHITALPAFTDNYLWLLQEPHTKRCAVVDPGDAQPVLDWLSAHPEWQLSEILITHHHHDHTGGISGLKAATQARVLGPARENIAGLDVKLDEGDSLSLLGYQVQVMAVPGHTLGHLAYYLEDLAWLFCGDTLFAAGCGRLFEGTAEQMHHSLSRFKALPDNTQVFCTHEYTLSNLAFAKAVEPHNAEIAARYEHVQHLREQGQISLPSNIALEKATNPFLRTQETSVNQMLDQYEGPAQRTPVQAFASLRAWKDHFKAS